MFERKELETYRRKLFNLLLKDAYREDAVVLSSGKRSSYYIDARRVTLNPEGAFYAANIILSEIEDIKTIKAVGGPSIGADPVVGAIAAISFLRGLNLKTFIVRKAVKDHGSRKQIEGPDIDAGSEVVIVDDVATTGSSLGDAALILKQNGLKVKQAIVIVDREEGAGENLRRIEIGLSSIFKITDFRN